MKRRKYLRTKVTLAEHGDELNIELQEGKGLDFGWCHYSDGEQWSKAESGGKP